MHATELTGVVAEHIAAVNAQDAAAIMATFADDAYVNDARREFTGRDAIRRWVDREMVGDKITIEVREVLDHYGDTIVRVPTRARSTGPTCRTRSCCPTISASGTARSSAWS